VLNGVASTSHPSRGVAVPLGRNSVRPAFSPSKGIFMHRRILTVPSKAKTLEQQKTDFTSEGSPPPDAVGVAGPERTPKVDKMNWRVPAILPAGYKGPL
jgi:hypothetical protein